MKKVIYIVFCILSTSLMAVTLDCLDDANVNFYQYTLTVSANDIVSSVTIGTHDGQISNYSNWVVPPGWSYTILPSQADDAAFDVHGVVVQPTGVCPYIIVFIIDQGTVADVGEYDFKFNNINRPHVAAWTAGSAATDWTFPIGLGVGPVHSPVPEPLTMCLMGLGGLYVMRKREI